MCLTCLGRELSHIPCFLAGADLFALPLLPLLQHDIRRFFDLARNFDDRYFFHDDVWLSLFLQDVAGVAVCPVTVSVSSTTFRPSGNKTRVRAPPQFLGPVHGLKETWATALRRLGGNTTRRLLNHRLGARRLELRQLVEEKGLIRTYRELRACDGF